MKPGERFGPNEIGAPGLGRGTLKKTGRGEVLPYIGHGAMIEKSRAPCKHGRGLATNWASVKTG